MKLALLGSVALASMVSFQAAAADEFNPKQAANEEFKPKRNEVSLFGNIDNSQTTTNGTSQPSQTATYITGEYGRYFTSKLVGKANLFLYTSGKDASETNIMALAVGLKYYFINGKKVSPFVMGDFGLSTMSMGGGTGWHCPSGQGACTSAGGGWDGYTFTGTTADVAVGIAIWMTEATALNIDFKHKQDSLTSQAYTVTSLAGTSRYVDSFSQTTTHNMLELGLTTKF